MAVDDRHSQFDTTEDTMNMHVTAEKHLCKTPWTPTEDNEIVLLVQKYGPNWVSVSEHMQGRTGKQCRERYYNHLQGGIKKGDWSQNEDQKILRLQLKYGNQWTRIMKELPGRTDNAVKNRFHALERAHAKIIDGPLSEDPVDASPSRAKKVSSNGGNMYKKAYMEQKKRNASRPGNVLVDHDLVEPNTPSTPTSVACIITPSATESETFRGFAWKPPTMEEYLADDEEAEDDSDISISIALGVDTVEATDLCDCMSPLMIKQHVAKPTSVQSCFAPAEVFEGLFEGVEEIASDDVKVTCDVRPQVNMPSICSLSGTPISQNQAEDEETEDFSTESEPITSCNDAVAAVEKVGLLNRLEAAMYADILELDLMSGSDSDTESVSCMSTDCDNLSDSLTIDVCDSDSDEEDSSVQLETAVVHPVIGNTYPIMLTSPFEMSVRFETAECAAAPMTSCRYAPYSADPSPVHKKTRYAIWA